MRPQSLDEINQREVLAVLSFGVSRNAAAGYVGCAPNTLRNAMRRDEKFAADVLAAERNCETQCLQNIREAGAKHWRAAAWLLEKRFPRRYGKLAEKLARDKLARKQAAREEQAGRDAPSFDSVNREYFDSRLSAVELREAALADAAEQLHGLRDDLIRRELELLAMEARARALDPAAAVSGIPPGATATSAVRSSSSILPDGDRLPPTGTRPAIPPGATAVSGIPPGATAVSAVRSTPSILPDGDRLPPTGAKPATPPGDTAVSAVRSTPSIIPAAAVAATLLLSLFLFLGRAYASPATASWGMPQLARLCQECGVDVAPPIFVVASRRVRAPPSGMVAAVLAAREFPPG